MMKLNNKQGQTMKTLECIVWLIFVGLCLIGLLSLVTEVLKGTDYEPMRRPSLPPLIIPPQPPHLPIMFIDEDEE